MPDLTKLNNEVIPQQMADLREQRNERLRGIISGISEDLTKTQTVDSIRMPERVFVGIWLPFFAGEEMHPQLKVDFTHWVNFTGNPYRAVEVVNTAGDVLFVVPAVYDRDAVNPVGAGRRSDLHHVVQSAQQLANVHPNQGMRYLDAELTKRALVMKVPPNVMANLETWNAIFKRYGRPPLAEIDLPKPAQPNQTGAGPEESDYEFEPL